MKKEKELFVAIPNCMFAFDSDFFVTNEELIVFYQLAYNVTARNPKVSKVNIELLNSLIEFDKSNPSRGKQKIKDALLGLHEKGYINIRFSDSKLKNATFIEARLPDLAEPIYANEITSGSWTYKGFTGVTHDMYERASTIEQLKVLIYVKWRSFSNIEKKVNYAISFQEWESVLDVSHTTAIKIIESCVTDGLIAKQRGQYYMTFDGQTRQETNKYKVIEEVAEKPLDIAKEINTRIKSIELDDKSTESRSHNWFNNDSYINEDDCYVYLTTTCNVLNEHAIRRINGVRKNNNGRQIIDNLLKKAEIRIQRERKDEKLRKERAERELIELMELEQRTLIKSTKKRYKDDISLFLDDEPVKRRESIEDWG
jgi:hypothetical protein